MTVTRPTADDRLRRLLAMVPWVAANEGPTVASVCERFGYSQDELAGELELLFMCGVHPFTPDTLIEADVDDGRVWIRYAEYFARPLRLTPAEGLAVLAAGVTLLQVPGTPRDGPLASGLAKLASTLGIDPDEVIDVELAPTGATVVADLQRAANEQLIVAMGYYSYGRDALSERVIEPHRVFNSAGQWYVSAHDKNSGEQRLFRLDRMRDVDVKSEHFDPPAETPDVSTFHPRHGDPFVVLALQPAAQWVASQYPNEGTNVRPDGTTQVTLRVGEKGWLERLLLLLGPNAAVTEGDDVGVAAAERRLRLYS